MSTPRMRPEFVCPLAADSVTFWTALDAGVARAAGAVDARRFDGGAILRLAPADRHVWSPALYLHVDRVDPESDGPWQLTGRFTPSSPVWTAFVAIYLVLACVATAAGCYGGAQVILGEPPWAFLGVAIALALAGFTYGAAFIGQGLGAEDMYRLRSFVDEVIASPA